MSSPGVLPPAYPAPLPDSLKPLRFYATGTATGAYAGNEFAFERVDPKDPAEPEQGWCRSFRITATTTDLNFSFDGTTDHGIVLAGEVREYLNRFEGGIAIKGAGTFYLEAW
jgi:hypothetical protein